MQNLKRIVLSFFVINLILLSSISYGYDNFQAGLDYIDGSIVQNANGLYQCKPRPYTGWCKIGGVYEPGIGNAWGQAWIQVSGNTGGETIIATNSSTSTSTVTNTNIQELSDELKRIVASAKASPGTPIIDLHTISNNPQNVQRVMSILPESKRNEIFPARAPVYVYKEFLKAIAKFPAICSEKGPHTSLSLDNVCRKELVTIFAHMTQETGGHSPGSWLPNNPGLKVPEWKQGLYYVEEMGCENGGCEYRGGTCEAHTWQGKTWPCPTGAEYFGRGAKQLSYNFNYGPFSKVIFGDVDILLQNPERVANEGWLAISSAIWFYMTPQSPKPSMHDMNAGFWKANAADIANGITAGFGATTNIINGGVECGPMQNEIQQSVNRISYYREFARELGLSIPTNEVLGCKDQKRFDSRGAGAILTYWEQNWTVNGECKLVNYQTPHTIFDEGSYGACVNYHFGNNNNNNNNNNNTTTTNTTNTTNGYPHIKNSYTLQDNGAVTVPYMDATLYPFPNLKEIKRDTGNTTYALGFIVSKNGCNASWGGQNDIKSGPYTNLMNYKKDGIEYIVSFGGAAGVGLFEACHNENDLQREYEKVINALGVNSLDFDIEGASLTKTAEMTKMLNVLKKIKIKYPTIEISFTLPVMPYGLTWDGKNFLTQIKEANLHTIALINIMTMDYGSPNDHMGQSAIQAVENLNKQMQSAYGITKNYYSQIGLTPMIGLNDVISETFTLKDAGEVNNYVFNKKIGRLSYWSLNRDHPDVKNYVNIQGSSRNNQLEDYEYLKTFRGNALVLNTENSIANTNKYATSKYTKYVLMSEEEQACLTKKVFLLLKKSHIFTTEKLNLLVDLLGVAIDDFVLKDINGSIKKSELKKLSMYVFLIRVIVDYQAS